MVRVGIIGGGQLARMMIPAAITLGFDVRVFADSEESSASVVKTTVGDYSNLPEVLAFAKNVDVVTFDHEHVPRHVLLGLIDAGVTLNPSPDALALTFDKSVMRRELSHLDIPQPRWVIVHSDTFTEAEVVAVGGFPCIAKKPIGGYDGKGVRLISSEAEILDWLDEGPVLLEEKVDFVRELSQLSAMNAGGDWAGWEVVQTTQVEGVCSEVLAPAPDLDSRMAHDSLALARRIAEAVGVIGVLAVELFETRDGRLLVNELAMRPHNSGHVYTELSVTSQFEQHLRAVAGYPLGSTERRALHGVMVNLFGAVPDERAQSAYSMYPEIKIHNYQKSPRSGRKAGHIVAVGKDFSQILNDCRRAAEIVGVHDYDGGHE